MKTFVEDFEYFKKELSYEKLFLEGMISEGRKRSEKLAVLILIAISVIITLLVINCWKDKAHYLSLFSIIYFIYLWYDANRSRKYLLKMGFPIPKEIYKWKSKELEIERIKNIYNVYDKTDSSAISQLIEIGKNRLNNGFNDPFIIFEKVVGFFGSSFFNFLLGFFMAILKDDLVKNFALSLKFFASLYLIPIIIVLSYYSIKNAHLFDKRSEKEHLQDYIFVLENILLRKNLKKNKNKTLPIK
jgi:hypothetical protein